MTTLVQIADGQARAPVHSESIRVRMSPRLLGAISEAARRKEITASAWVREAATALARSEGTLPTINGPNAGKVRRRLDDRAAMGAR